MHLTADSEENHRRFVSRTARGERVWALAGPNGVSPCQSCESERDVLPFWSDAAYARRAAREWSGTDIREVGLFDFLFRWLTGMAKDDVLVGPNWSGDLAGVEVEPLVLQAEILEAMPENKRRQYLELLEQRVKAQV